ncbi:MAG TPA: O-antigen ligase family protein [Nocardioidaceae bacterium]|nr:O-antigen ligase family protein [Nocardioidaceae bacterium]
MTQSLVPAVEQWARVPAEVDRSSAANLPRWPVAALFVGFPVWWALGLVDAVWIPMAAVMALYLAESRGVRLPRGFGVYLVFLAWAGASAIMLSGGAGPLVGFLYRLLIYVSAGVLFVYVYNARRWLTARYVTGCLTSLWVTTVVGGYLGLLLPTAVVRTPLSYVLPASLTSNDLVNHMVIRRLAQFNPDSFLQVAPRPSAPFLYTNNWGNAYSLLLPFVLAYLFHVRGERRFLWVAVMLPVSAVPALLTLNRGMFLGLGIAMVYATVRLALRGRRRAVATIVALAAVGALLYSVLPVEQRLGNRLDPTAQATSNDTRASLYLQALQLVPESPVFGFGAPQEGENPNAAPVGTQGQVWVLLVSHGPLATLCFVGWFLLAFARTRRRMDPDGFACSTALLVGTLELAYYGVVPNGLPIMMVAAALGMRGVDRSSGIGTQPEHRVGAGSTASRGGPDARRR